MKISLGLSGHAGQYFVCAELSKRGWLASLTLANAEDIDILAHHVETKKNVAIQVKATRGVDAKWLLSSRSEKLSAPHLFYVFVRLGGEDERPVFHIVASEVIREEVSSSHSRWLSSSKKNGDPRKDSSIRQFLDREEKYRNKWSSLLDEKEANQTPEPTAPSGRGSS